MHHLSNPHQAELLEKKNESKSKSPRKTKRSLWYDDCSDVTPLTPDDNFLY